MKAYFKQNLLSNEDTPHVTCGFVASRKSAVTITVNQLSRDMCGPEGTEVFYHQMSSHISGSLDIYWR